MSKVDLYPHNQTAYLKIKQAIENGDNKMAIAHATGTGKSYISLRLFEDYNDNQKLVLVPTNFLYQNHKGLFDEYGIRNTNVMTYQSLIKRDSEEINNMDYKVIVLDEYHHSTAKKWGESVRDLIKSHPNTIFLGTSATPVRTDGVNTIDEMFDSNCVSELPVSKAIALGILPMPRYVAVDYAYDKRFDELAKKVDKSSCTKEEKEEYHKQIKEMRLHVDQSYGMPIILNKYIENESGKYIVFCRNKKHLEEIKDTVIGWFSQAGFRNVNSYVVHSQNEEKDKEFKEFCNDNSSNLKLLFCINMLSEGLHLKGISGVVLMRTTSSYIVFQQQIGRALDANNNRIPLIIDAVNNYSYVQDGIKLFEDIKKDLEERSSNFTNDVSLCDIASFLIVDQVQDIKKVFSSIEDSLIYKCCASWTNEEDDILRNNYISNGMEYCLKLLSNKTRQQCYYRLRQLDIHRVEQVSWSDEEVSILLEYYHCLKIDELEKLLVRHSKSSIQAKAQDLKLNKSNRVWTKEEIKYLFDNYAELGANECAIKLKKTPNAVMAWASKLKIPRYKKEEWSKEEMEIVFQKYPLIGSECLQYLNGKTKQQLYNFTRRNSIKFNNNMSRSKSSGHKFVYYDNRRDKWRVEFYVGNKFMHFGEFKELNDAINEAKIQAEKYGKCI